MSEPLRIGFVVEGPTDRLVLESVSSLLLGGREYEPVQLIPQLSDAFAALTPGGWPQVYFWCRQTAAQAGGAVRDAPLFETFDLLIIQVDADVAERSYTDDQRIADTTNDLPCDERCPPASATTNALRRVILRWMGEAGPPPKTVFCTPSKAIETWVLVALFPNNRFSQGANVECHPKVESQLQGQPLPQRLIRGGKKEIQKYQERALDIAAAWPRVRERCTEAERFSIEFQAAVP
jgi:hypothetical protein